MSDEKYIIHTVGDFIDFLMTMEDMSMDEMFFIAKIDGELVCINKGSQRDIGKMLVLMAIEDQALAKIIDTVAGMLPSPS